MSPDFFNRIKDFSNYFQGLIDNNNDSQASNFLKTIIKTAASLNRWFTEDNITLRIRAICDFINSAEFEIFYSKIEESNHLLHFGINSDENIPIEEFPVLISILLSGNSFIYKTSAKSDKILIFFFEQFLNYFPEFSGKIKFSDVPLRNTDGFIVTKKESSNSVIDQYLQNKKSYLEIRHNSVAILNKNESSENLSKFGGDLFYWFGLGYGNVKKIYVPLDFDFKILFEAIEPWNILMHHNAYMNNYQYSQSVFLLNKISHLDNGFLLVRKDSSFTASVGVINYEYYENKNLLMGNIAENKNIFSIYSSNPTLTNEKVFGSSIKQLLLPSENLIKFLHG